MTAAFDALWSSLDSVEDERDRSLLLDSVRSALDRGARTAEPGRDAIVADTFLMESLIAATERTVVFKLRHRDLHTVHAMKTLPEARSNDPMLARLLRREAAHQAAVSHPAVLKAEILLRLPDGRPALWTPHVEGGTLKERLRSGLLPSADALVLARRLLEGLAAIHSAGLLHLDVTPANIFLAGSNLVLAQIADFGLSLPIGRRPAEDELAVAGTLAFQAPEQADPAHELDPRADIYGFGRVLLAALGGGRDETSTRLRELAATCAAARRDDRPEDVATVFTALERIAPA